MDEITFEEYDKITMSGETSYGFYILKNGKKIDGVIAEATSSYGEVSGGIVVQVKAEYKDTILEYNSRISKEISMGKFKRDEKTIRDFKKYIIENWDEIEEWMLEHLKMNIESFNRALKVLEE